MNSAYRIALSCGGIPLCAGVSIFLCWLITRWPWLMLAGYANIAIGIVLFVVGAIALGRYRANATSPTRAHVRRRNWIALTVLLINFPVAGGLAFAAIAIETSYTVVIENASSAELVDVRVTGGGVDEYIESIPPGGVAKRTFWIRQDGELNLQAVTDAGTINATVEGYVTPNAGGRAEVIIHSDGTVTVHHDRRW